MPKAIPIANSLTETIPIFIGNQESHAIPNEEPNNIINIVSLFIMISANNFIELTLLF